MSDAIPLLLDTDIGSDIDDAVALAYLLRQPRCNLLGITTVTGPVEQRAACAQVICAAAGRPDVPIHCGASDVLLIGPGQPACPQHAAIAGLPFRREWPRHTAVDFLRDTIRRHPGQITLLTIGPLTNIALLFALDPEIPSLLKEMVSMVGVFFDSPERREWNAMVDPIATAMVFKAPVPRITCFGLDVTNRCQMPAPDVRSRFRTPPLDLVARMAEVWFSQRAELTFHDPLAAAAIFHPELCSYVDGRVCISVDGDERKAGHTVFSPQSGGPHRIARSVNADAFFSEYFSAFRK